MRTLDEVIDAVENCYCLTEPIKGCDQCPYYGECNRDGDPYRDDVLHYLKEYRSDQIQWEADREDWRDKWETYIEARERHLDAVKELKRNDLLTWQELQQMEGKPVWMEYDNHLSGRKQTKYKDWEVIDMIEEDMIHVKGDYSYQKDEFGDVWQAYRKERS